MPVISTVTRESDNKQTRVLPGPEPKLRQSGKLCRQPREDQQGRSLPGPRCPGRGSLVSLPHAGPLRAFYQRIYARRGYQTALVATARKLTVLAWHLASRDEDYAFARPGLVARKWRKLELIAGYPSRQSIRSQPSQAYSSKQRRDHERQAAEQAERAYQALIAHWQKKRPATFVSSELCEPRAARPSRPEPGSQGSPCEGRADERQGRGQAR